MLAEEAAKPEPDPWLLHLQRRLIERHEWRLFNGRPTALTDADRREFRDLLEK